MIEKRPKGSIANPLAMQECRKRGWPLTMQAISDAAKLANLPAFVPDTDEAFRAGEAISLQARRDAVASARGLTPGASPRSTLPPLPSESTSAAINAPPPRSIEGKPALRMTDAEFAAALKHAAWR